MRCHKTIINIIILFPILIGLLQSCSSVHVAISFSPQIEDLREGERKFAEGNYTEAEAIFLKVYNQNRNPQTKNTALYNLTCTRIITSKSDEDYLQALALLDEWEQSSPSIIYIENPNLVIRALKEYSSVLNKENQALTIQRKRIQGLEEAEKRNALVIENQIKTIKDLKEALSTLQHQIAELEAIDQQLQEKKKPL